jgi:hypothetical protein
MEKVISLRNYRRDRARRDEIADARVDDLRVILEAAARLQRRQRSRRR